MGHLYRAACVDHCVMVLMAFLTRAFTPCELVFLDLAGFDATLRVEAFERILFPLLPLHQHVHVLVRGIKI